MTAAERPPRVLPRHRLVYSCAEHEDCREHPELGVACWRASVGPPIVEPEMGIPTVEDGDNLDAAAVTRLLATVERQRRQLRAQELFYRGAWTADEANAYRRTGLEPA